MEPVSRYETLLEVSRAIAERSTLDALFADLRRILNRLLQIDFLILATFDEAGDTITLRLLDAEWEHHAPIGNTYPLAQSPARDCIREQRPIYFPDRDEIPHEKLRSILVRDSIGSMVYFPLTTAHTRVGSLGAGNRHRHYFTPEVLEFFALAVRQIAIGVENALAQEKLAAERDRLRAVLALNHAIAHQRELKPLVTRIAEICRPVLQQDYLALTLYDKATHHLVFEAIDFPESRGFILESAGLRIPVDGTQAGEAYLTGELRIYGPADLPCVAGPGASLLREEGIACVCAIPLATPRRSLGTLHLGSRRADAFNPQGVALLHEAAGPIALAIENALAFDRIAELNARLEREKLYLEEEIRSEYPFDEIIGNSPVLRKVLEEVETVAPTDSTVLILGESGTGKELIARAIHNRSQRSRGTFVRMNCAAIPTGLLESEIFGHERGAFTGAISTKVGRFELADRGTLFLDEIGEVSLDIQPKLLRVLQEKEFERLGSTRTIRSDARIIAATNRDLRRMVDDREFRLDLFYRLNIFPITVPPLAERRGDIPMLVRHFTREYARKLGRSITQIRSEAMEAMERYPWPGNIRELQNFIERSVLLTRGDTLVVHLDDLGGRAPAENGAAPTLSEVERQAILSALDRTGGTVGGPQGAAALLGLKRTTLLSRMEKLGIAPRARR